jgi:regulatory protein
VPGRRRGARTGRGWDAAPPRSRSAKPAARAGGGGDLGDYDPGDAPLWIGEEEGYTRSDRPAEKRAEARAEEWAEEWAERRPEERAERRTERRPEERAERPAERARGKPEQDPAERAREICLRQLAVRPRTRAELAAALRKHGVADEVADSVLDRYDEVGIIDDAAFARAWVSSRHHGRGLARRALASELRRKGVAGDLVGEALTEVDGDTEAATARDLVHRKLRSMSSAPPDAVFRRLVGLLARKGYPPGLAVRVVKDALAERDAEGAAFADLVDPDAMPGLVGDSDDPIR